MTIQGQFLPHLQLHEMYITEEFTKNEYKEDAVNESSSCNSVSTIDSRLDSSSRLDIQEVIPKGILKPSSTFPRAQLIPDYHPSRSRHRRRRKSSSTKSNPSKYDRVKARFYALEDEGERPDVFRSQRLRKKTLVDKECLKTCRRFL